MQSAIIGLGYANDEEIANVDSRVALSEVDSDVRKIEQLQELYLTDVVRKGDQITTLFRTGAEFHYNLEFSSSFVYFFSV